MHSKPAAPLCMSNWSKPALIAAAFALAAPQADAQTRDLSGQWAFRSENAAIGCTISGQATVHRMLTVGRYDVRFRATEACRGAYESWAEERCVATETQNHLSVRCRVDRSNAGGYLPDDFELEIGGDGVMRGLLTANWNAPAEWRRLDAANVS